MTHISNTRIPCLVLNQTQPWCPISPWCHYKAEILDRSGGRKILQTKNSFLKKHCKAAIVRINRGIMRNHSDSLIPNLFKSIMVVSHPNPLDHIKHQYDKDKPMRRLELASDYLVSIKQYVHPTWNVVNLWWSSALAIAYKWQHTFLTSCIIVR